MESSGALCAHDIVTVLEGPYADLSGTVTAVGEAVTVWCYGFEPFDVSTEQLRRVERRQWPTDCHQGLRIERDMVLRRIHLALESDDRNCVRCGEQLELGV